MTTKLGTVILKVFKKEHRFETDQLQAAAKCAEILQSHFDYNPDSEWILTKDYIAALKLAEQALKHAADTPESIKKRNYQTIDDRRP